MGKIILLRHGEVNIKEYKNIWANEFEKWTIEYNNSDIKSNFSSKDEIKNIINQTNVLVCSKLKRSIQSVEIFDKTPFEINELFNEAEIPFSNWNLLKLQPKIWLVFFRVLWFFGYSQNCESFKDTKQRVKKATKRLIDLSKQNKSVILIGHGILNKLIAKELISQRWNQTKKSQNKNWDYGIFELI